ncbi:MAG: hypothetical protein KDC67_03655 [Ignavibacteriae bacterium]|nr:hypothetical protein [Ignavibacteriota bacterium]
MKKLIVIPILILSLILTACSSDDDSGDTGPQTVNITLEITTSRNTEAIVTRTLNNDIQTENLNNLPYSFTYAQQEVSTGTYLKLTFLENGSYDVGPNGSSWTDYTTELKILVGNNVVESETFTVTESSAGTVRQIEYTF